MRLPDGPRQIAAGLIAAGAFVALFFGLVLVWWAALIGAVAVYAAALLMIRRRLPLDEIHLSAQVTAADVARATDALDQASARLARAAEAAPRGDRDQLLAMSRNLGSIRQSVATDPEDYRTTRRFIGFYLPKIVETVDAYVRLAGMASGDQAARIEALGRDIGRFDLAIREIDQACLENDVQALEVQVDVLAKQMDRGRRV